jgi:tetratricopeptide (TPR) repeat protein
MPARLTRLLLVSASAVAITGAHAQTPATQGFLVEAPQPPSPAGRAVGPSQKEAAPVPAPQPQRRAPALAIKPIDAEEGGPDETALRYYAAQNQTRRVALEIERLQRLYPYWRPPETLVEPASTSSEDEQPLWDLFGADRMDELRAAIELRQKQEPDWRPSKDLTDKIARKELRLRLMGMWRAGQLNDIIAAVRQDGYGGDRADIDLQWTVAETYARMKQTGEALDIYRSILRTAPDPKDRIATIQKAMDTMRMSEVEKLLVEARIDEAGRSDLAPLAIDITRARISAYLHDERPEPVPAAEVRTFEAYARGVNDANQSGLVAWHHLKNRQYSEALEWFKLALERGGDAMVAHGLAHVLREKGMLREAEEVAFAWREPLANNAILYIDVLEAQLTNPVPPYVEPERLARYAQVTVDLASGEGAQALGWYAYNTCQFEAAYEWFQRAVAWYPKETTVVGLMLASQKLKRTKDFFELANRYDGLFPKALALLFPDGYQRPPSPCDLLASGRVAPAATRALAPQPAPVHAAPRHFGASPPPAAGMASQHWAPQSWGQHLLPVANDQLPKFARGEFPAAVELENHRRFASSGKLMGRPAASAAPPAAQTALRMEQPAPAQLVARRVQGVSAMPYERWGFSLLPGANGQTAADAPHSAQVAPAGTAWASEGAAAANAPAFVDPHQAMQAIASASRAPLPPAPRVAPGQAGVLMRNAALGGDGVDMTPTASIPDDPLADAPAVLRDSLRAREFVRDDEDAPDLAARAHRFEHSRREDMEAFAADWRPRLSRLLSKSPPGAQDTCPPGQDPSPWCEPGANELEQELAQEPANAEIEQ